MTKLRGAARVSNQALSAIGPAIHWQRSYVSVYKTYRIHLADGEDSIRNMPN